MVIALAVTDAITDLNQAHERFGLVPIVDPSFFPEWQGPLPELTQTEMTGLDRLRDRYLYYAADGFISEGTINTVMLSPLLELLGFFDPPYKVQGEYFVRLTIAADSELDDDGEPIVLRGRIDALVLQNRLWVILVEAKPYHEPVGFSVLQALPQTLAYMMAKPIEGAGAAYAMITNGEDYMFVKLDKSSIVKGYGQSHKFTLLSDADHNLYRVARVLKCIAQ
jgi:hypothetical protein